MASRQQKLHRLNDKAQQTVDPLSQVMMTNHLLKEAGLLQDLQHPEGQLLQCDESKLDDLVHAGQPH